MKSSFSERATPVACAPRALAICTANGPTLSDAPTMRDLVPWPDGPTVTKPERLEREDGRVRQGRRLLERHPSRDRRKRLLGGEDVLGEGSLLKREQVSEGLR